MSEERAEKSRVGLVTEEIARVNLRTRHAWYYLLRDREAVKDALRTVTDLTPSAVQPILD